MVQFNELRITPDGKNLIIDVSIDDLKYYSNVFIDSVIIDNEETFSPSGPSSNPIYSYTVDESGEPVFSSLTDSPCNPILCDEDNTPCIVSNLGNTKNLRLVLNSLDFVNQQDLNTGLFFVYVNVRGIPSPDTPCGLDNESTIGIVFNKVDLYRICMGYFRELESTCNIPKGFIDFILRMKGLELSIKTGNYIQAIKYWNKFFKGKSVTSISNCRC